LRTARFDKDIEIVWRAKDLLDKLDTPGRQAKQDLTTEAALQWLLREKPEGSAALLLEIVPYLGTPAAKDIAARALLAAATPADTAKIRRAVTNGPARARACLLPALEKVDGANAEAIIVPLLKDADMATRLAAARALLDRQPAATADALTGLLEADDEGLMFEAARLLQLASGFPKADGDEEWADLVPRWKKWATTPDAAQPRALGMARYNCEPYGLLLVETFARDTTSLKKHYGQFSFESTTTLLPGGREGATTASVSQGRLRIEGLNTLSDQQFIITAEKLVNRPMLPRHFQVRAKIGGEAAGSGAWHVGVSVGHVRVLFHPNLEGGCFRIERTDGTKVLVPNESMGFIPAAGVLHNMTVDVCQNPDETVTLTVTVEDGNKKGSYRKKITVKKEAFGPVDRVSLDRSGNQGGAALFGAMSIRR
jgi:hypothetical protein